MEKQFYRMYIWVLSARKGARGLLGSFFAVRHSSAALRCSEAPALPNSHAHHGGITGTCFTERGGQAYSHSQRHLETYVLVIYLSFIRYTDVLFDTLFSHDHVWCRIENSAEEHLLQDEIVSTVNDSDCQYYITNAIWMYYKRLICHEITH